MPRLFTLDPDWTDGFDETIEFETAVMESRDGSEQRESLLQEPNKQYAFTAFTTTTRETGLLEVLIRSGQAERLFVPCWPSARRLTASISPGAVSVPINGVDARFVAGEAAMLWRDPFTAEQVEVTSVGLTSIGVTATTFGWSKNNGILVPLKVARLAPDQDLTYLSRDLDKARVVFDVEDLALSEL